MNFIIKYKAFSSKGKIIKQGKIRAKNKPNKFAAQCGFEDHLKKTLPEFSRLEVESCKEETLEGFFNMEKPFWTQ